MGEPVRLIGHARPSGIGDLLVSCRSLAEYLAMFALDARWLRGRRVLDCPGGAASFTAGAWALGADAVACDPVYADLAPATLTARAHAENDRANAYVRAHPDEYVWTFFRDPDHHHTTRRTSASYFAEHLAAHPECYRRGALPELPFADGDFDLALSSHLLFSYADRFDEAFHLAALRELVRVSRQVRVFPLAAMGTATPLELDGLRAALATNGVRTEVRKVDYEFQRGCHAMLVCTRVEPAAAPGAS